jgi:rSAM/selenodomain-associated transferase 1
MRKENLLVFQRNAVLGKVKTRLAARLGEQRALAIYRYLVTQTHHIVSTLSVPIGLFIDEELMAGRPAFAQWMCLQEGKDLGEKMANAFQKSAELGAERMVLIGTDCPSLTSDLVVQAFELLDQADLVLGPASDGGYYLVGMKQLQPTLFEGIAWSTSTVFLETINRAESASLSVCLLPVLDDVDTAADWEKYVAQHPEVGYL